MVEAMNTEEDLGGAATMDHRLSDHEDSPPPPQARDSSERDLHKPIGPESPSSSPPPPRPRSRGRERDSRERPNGPENSGDSSPPRGLRSRDWPNGPGEREFDRPNGPPPPRSRSRGRERDSREREFSRPNGPGGRERDFREREFERPMRREFYREREYNKRSRPSFSPPPPPYRQRRGGGGGRYSPPRRRSPPFNDYKRRRGDNGGYIRRGSPRGGFGGADRRFYNDYPDVYDREMESRHDYPEERHGRNMGRSSGGYRASFDSGRIGGQADAFNAGRSKREGLMSYKQFIQELEDDVLPSEAEHRYQEYRAEYISTQKKAYFDAHKDEEWLKDKYHPTNLVAVIERRNDLARKQAKDFQLDLQSGVLDLGPSVTASSSNKSGQPNDHGSDGEEGGKRNRHGRGSAKEEDLFSAAPKAHPVSSESRRIQIDVEQAQALVRKLDFEKGIEDNILCRSDNDRAGRDKSHGASSGPVIIIRGLTSVKGLEGIELRYTLTGLLSLFTDWIIMD
ncbi:hypothetical protein Leryth_009059 [Lithospermum erythrorhizon]|nr:hypothetical protein Leryth_009059 [Lithospermum erythrorhizon]